MIIIGCDFHTRFQQIAMLEVTTGELVERRLEHENGDAERFYATINAQWFERMLQRHQHELWIGDAAEIRAARVRKQKTDARDALHILDLLLPHRFPRIWIPSPVERDVRQLVRQAHATEKAKPTFQWLGTKVG
jgi:transposase